MSNRNPKQLAGALAGNLLAAARPADAPVCPPTFWDIVRASACRGWRRPIAARNAARDTLLLDAAVAVRANDCDTAARLLAPHRAAMACDSGYLNLCGVICEARRQWKAAGRFYGLAMSVDPAFEPARHNMQHLYELNAFGRAFETAKLGDIELRAARIVDAQRSCARPAREYSRSSTI